MASAEGIVAAVQNGVLCPHNVGIGSGEACLKCQEDAIVMHETMYKASKEANGLDDDNTLTALFLLFDKYIQSYKLTECDALLNEGLSTCKGRGKADKFNTKMIQALAFLRFKQAKFKEAAGLFEEMKELVGPCAELCENMGHAYNSCGDYQKAEEAFEQSLAHIKLKDSEQQANSNMGGVLLGLGLVRLNRGSPDSALPMVQQALDWFKKAHEGDHSLQAKAGSSVARTYEALGNLPKAEEHYRESVRIFRITCGDDSPLTATALSKLGNVLLSQGKPDALDVMDEALKANCEVDMYSVHLQTVAGLLVQLMNNLGATPARLQSRAPAFSAMCGSALDKLRNRGDAMDDADAAVFFKCYGELVAITGDLSKGKTQIERAVKILDTLESESDASPVAVFKLQCVNLLAVIEQVQAQKSAGSSSSAAAGSSSAGPASRRGGRGR